MPNTSLTTILRQRTPLVLLAVLLVFGAIAGIWRVVLHEDLPAFSEMRAEARKERFTATITPLIRKANADIREDRQLLLSLKTHHETNGELWFWPRYRLDGLADKYKVKTENRDTEAVIDALLPRVQRVPALLVMAQAVKESGWGTSRFAQQANNLFGQRCRSKGCGIVPKQRKKGADYEVQAYATPYDSIKSYMMNLNTHYAYARFRSKRRKLDTLDSAYARTTLARSLRQYSERRGDYVEEVIAMMQQLKRESDRLP
jgi:Bax protein